LDSYFSEHDLFDFIYILGHSLPHLNIKLIPRTLKQIHDGLSPRGIFAFDIRPWERVADGILIQSNRLPDIYRYLGTVYVDGEKYLLEERIVYERSYQKVIYKFSKIGPA